MRWASSFSYRSVRTLCGIDVDDASDVDTVVVVDTAVKVARPAAAVAAGAVGAAGVASAADFRRPEVSVWPAVARAYLGANCRRRRKQAL